MEKFYIKSLIFIALVIFLFVKDGFSGAIEFNAIGNIDLPVLSPSPKLSEHRANEFLPGTKNDSSSEEKNKATKPAPNTTITNVVTDASCFGMSDGAINITVSGGATPYGFNWSNGATTQNINNLTAASYTVSVWDGTWTIANFSVNEPPQILVNVSYSNYNGAGVSCSSSTNGWIDLSVSGGVPPYQYAWNGGQTTQDLANLPGGIYDFTITDGISCEVMTSSNGNISGIPFIWSYVQTLNSHSVFLPANKIKIDGTVISIGDMVGAFFEQSAGVYMCGGYSEWTGAVNSVALWPDDNLTMIKDGFLQSDSIYWKIWRASDSTIFNAKPYYLPLNNFDGKFYNNGMTLIDSLIADYDENSLPSIVLPEPLPLLISAELSDYGGYGVSTAGANDGSIELTVEGGTTPYTIIWSTGQFGAILQNLTAGSYTATVSDVNGCSIVETYILTQLQSITLTPTFQHVSCFGVSDGAINLSVSGGATPYTFSWSNGASTQNISGLAAGSYEVFIVDANSQIIIGSYIINQPPSLGLIPSYSDFNGFGVPCSNDALGWISVDVNGGTAPYQFLWSTGATIDSVFLLPGGAYNLTVIDADGCMVNTTSNTIETGVAFNWSWQNTGNNQSVAIQNVVKINNALVSNGDMIGAFYEQSPTIFLCAGFDLYNGMAIGFPIWGDDQLTTVKEGFGANDSVYWKIWRASDSTIFNAVPYYTPLPGNNGYFVTNGLMVIDSLIATFDENSQSSFVLTAPPLIQVSASLSNYNGYNISTYGGSDGSIDVFVHGGAPPYSYTWIQSGLSGTSVQNLSAGTYGIYGSDANACPYVQNFLLTQPAQLLLFPDGFPVTCYGGSDGSLELFLYGGIAPYKVDWWDGSTEIINVSTTVTKNNLHAGNYGVTVMDASGWPAPAPRNWYDEVTGSDHSLLIPLGVPITLDGVPIANGDYISVYYDSLGTLRSGALGINNTNLTSGIGLFYEGPSNSYQITARGEDNNPFIEFGFNTNETFNWRLWRASDSLLIPLTPVFETFSPDGNNYGNNGLSVIQSLTGSIWESFPGAVDSAIIMVTQPDPIEMVVVNNSIDCSASAPNPLSSGVLDILITVGNPPYTFNWSNGETSQNLINLPSGNYFVTVTDAIGCTRKFSETVFIDTVPSFTLPADTAICAGESYTLAPMLDNQLCYDYCDTCNIKNYCESYAVFDPVYNGAPDFEEYIASVSLDGNIQTNDSSTYSDYTSYSMALLQRGGIYTLITQIEVVVPGQQENVYAFFDWNRDGDFDDLNETQPIAINQSTSFIDSISVFVPFNSSLGETKMRIILKGDSIPGSCDENIMFGEVEDYKIEIYDVIACNPQYSWTGPSGFTSSASEIVLNNIVAANQGTYSLTVTYPNSCESTDNMVLTVNQGLNPITGINYIQHITCNGYNNGSLGIQTHQSDNNASFLWSNGSTIGSIGSLSAGNYSVTITKVNGCFGVFDTTILEPPAVNLSTTLNHVTCPGGNDGSINLNVSGGVPPYIYNWSNGEHTQDISNLSAGSYNVTIIDDYNCYTFSYNIITEPPAFDFNETIQNVTCYAAGNGSINLTFTGGTTPYTFAWSNGATTEDLSGLSGGTYSLTVTDGNVCEVTNSFTVLEPTEIVATETIQYLQCFGDGSGGILLNVSGGTAPYSFAWSNSASTQDLTSLAAGNYSVTITDANSCSVSFTYTVNQPDVLSISYPNNIEIDCIGDSTGQINLTPSGGTLPYSYNWSNGETTQDIENLYAGDYLITVTDANGCVASGTIEVEDGNVVVDDTITTPVSCNGVSDGSINFIMTGEQSPYIFLWSNGATTEDLLNIPAGSYSVTMTDEHDCIYNYSFVITGPAPIVVTATPIDNACFSDSNGSIDISVSGGPAPYTFIWSNGETTEDITGLLAGTYTLTVTDASSCTITTSYTIMEPPVLSLSNSIFNILCYGDSTGSIDLTVSGGVSPYSFGWSNGQTTEDINNLLAGNYSVTITDTNLCILTASYVLSQPDLLFMNNTTPLKPSCFGSSDGSINITVSGGTQPYTFSWTNGATTEDISGLISGSYTVEVTDFNGCITGSVIYVGQPQLLTLSNFLITNVSCYGDSIGSIDITPTGGTIPYSYQWSTGNSTQDLINLQAGLYNLTLSDLKGCDSIFTFTVTQGSEIILSAIANPVACNGISTGSIDLTVSGGVSPYSFLWSTGMTSEDLNMLAAGSYSVTVTDSISCTQTGQLTVSEASEIVLSAVVNPILCFGDSTGAINLSVSGGVSPYTFLWSSGISTEDLNQLAAGTYLVTVTDFNSCTQIDTFTVSQPPNLQIMATIGPIFCTGGSNGSINVTPFGGTPPYTYSWTGGYTTQDLSNLSVGTYSITLTDANGCQKSQSISVQAISALTAAGSVTDVSCNGDSNGSIDLSVSGGTPAYAYFWSNLATSQDISGLVAGNYSVTVSDAHSCQYTTGFVVTEPVVLDATATITDALCFGDANGAVDLTVTGGTLGYSFGWSNGASTEDITSLLAGPYSVTVTDANGCVFMA
ncbi:MAG: SprB repeat-containing protein, partial [Bacteroidales bacterium]|nr:SprB repeat-containing protein [Bacteroidales bacterium]MCF8454932.1 SprB repeat-containing protein [Bacteroidales bacterium]